MAKGGARAFHPQVDPNVIPFIDVLLVLLIIFMVTAPKPTTDLRVDLPPPVPGPASLIEPTIVDLRTAPLGYAIFVGGAPVTLDQLGASALEHIVRANPALAAGAIHAEARVFVRSELDVAYAPVVGAVEALRLAGFDKVSIVAQSADDA